mgnify:FL=1
MRAGVVGLTHVSKAVIVILAITRREALGVIRLDEDSVDVPHPLSSRQLVQVAENQQVSAAYQAIGAQHDDGILVGSRTTSDCSLLLQIGVAYQDAAADGQIPGLGPAGLVAGGEVHRAQAGADRIPGLVDNRELTRDHSCELKGLTEVSCWVADIVTRASAHALPTAGVGVTAGGASAVGRTAGAITHAHLAESAGPAGTTAPIRATGFADAVRRTAAHI